MSEPRYHVFLSHSSNDKPAVEELAHRLVREGIEPFLYEWHLIPGDPWEEELEKALARSAACAVLVGPSGISPWQNDEMYIAIRRRVQDSQQTFRVIPVLLPGCSVDQRASLPDLLTRTTWVQFRETLDDADAFRRLCSGIRGIAPGAGAAQSALDESVVPYRGLEFFDVDHAPLFFGREKWIEALLDRVRPMAEERGPTRLLVIIGASGSGKSSLARAGLVAALKRGRSPGSQDWPVSIMRPGPNPLESLYLALDLDNDRDPAFAKKQIAALEKDPEYLHVATSLELKGKSPGCRHLLLVDQFEEIFTLCSRDDLRRAFVSNLLYAARAVRGRTLVVLAMRADFWGKCAAHEELVGALAANQTTVGPLTEDELRSAIEGPAFRAGCEVESALTERLLGDVRGQRGALPLLQFALTEVWKKREGRKLTLMAYTELGRDAKGQERGIDGVLEHRADEIYGSLEPSEQRVCRRLFLRLVQPGEGTEDTRRRVSYGELLPNDPEGAEAVRGVIDVLSGPDARLITTGRTGEGDGAVEVAHEAIIRGWTKFRQWVEAERAGLRIQRRLSEAAREWEAASTEERADYLYSGARLAEARERIETDPDDLSTGEATFLKASAQAETKRRRLQVLLKVGGYGLPMAVSVALLALYQWYAEKREGDTARRTLYGAQMSLAQRAWIEARIPRIHELLRAYAPKPGQLALFEWRYLSYRTNLNLRKFVDHGGLVTSVAFSPDGKRLASGSADSKVRLWDAERGGGALRILSGHEDRVTGVAFSQDGKRLASASWDKTIRIWEIGTGEELLCLRGHTAKVTSVAFSPDGKRLVSGSWDNTVKVWDSLSGKQIFTTKNSHASGVNGVAYSPDGKLLVSASSDTTIKIWDAGRGDERGNLTGHNGPVSSVAFSPDGALLASASGDNTVKIWYSQTLLFPDPHGLTLRGHIRGVSSVAFSRDGKRLASGSFDYTAKIWDTESGQEIRTIKGHTEGLSSVAFAPDNKRLATASWDKSVRVWDPEEDQDAASLHAHKNEVSSVAFSPDSKRLASASWDKTVRIWDANDYRVLTTVPAHDNRINAVAFSHDGSHIVTGSSDNSVRVWDAVSGKRVLGQGGTHDGPVWAVAFSLDGKRLASASADRTVKIWDTSTGQSLMTLQGHAGDVQSVAFSSPDVHRIATGSSDKTVRVWDAGTGRMLWSKEKHTDQINCVAFSPDGKHLASASRDLRVMIWDVNDPESRRVLEGHASWVTGVAFNPASNRVATCSVDNSVRIWDIETGQELLSFQFPAKKFRAVAFTPDGLHLAAGAADGIVTVWEAPIRPEVRR